MGRDTADGLVPLTLWSQALLLAVLIYSAFHPAPMPNSTRPPDR